MNSLASFTNIKIFVFDIDGVLTNGQLLVQEDGTLLRSMNIKDGYALQLAIKCGYEIIIISGGQSAAAQKRLSRLGLKDIFIAVEDKRSLLEELINERHWKRDEILYMGDDMPDIEVMITCGLKCCPRDAVAEIKQIADYISPLSGGYGCVRDVIEKTLKIQGKWQ